MIQRSLLSALTLATLCLTFFLTGCDRPEKKAAKALAEANYELNTEDFVKAAGKGDLEAVKNFLLVGAELDGKDSRGYTALIFASEQGHAPVVEELLSNGAQANVVANDGWTALMMAAYQNHPEVIAALLKHDADPNLRDSRNWTALMKAVFQGHDASVKLLAPKSPEELDRALMLAALKGHTEVTGSLLDAGADVNGRTEDQQTALMFSAMSGHTETSRLLVQRGADTRAVDKRGNSSAFLALQKGHVDLSRFIETSSSASGGLTTVPSAGDVTPQDPIALDPASTPPATPMTEPAATPFHDPLAVNTEEIPPVATSTLPDTSLLPTAPEMPNPGDIAPLPTPNDLPASDDAIIAGDLALLTGSPLPMGGGSSQASPSAPSDFVFVEYREESMPFVLASVVGSSATVRFLDGSERNETVANGEVIPGTPYRAARIQQRSSMTKEDIVEDLSQMVAIHTGTNEETLMLVNLPTRSPASFAMIRHVKSETPIRVQAGREFTLVDDPSSRFLVLETGPDQVLLQQLPGGELVTVAAKR